VLVTELSKRARIPPDTVRYYTRPGLLNPSRQVENAYRVYGASDLRRLRFIRAAKGLGYTLPEIRQMFADADGGKSTCPRVRTIIERRIAETEEHLAELIRLRDRMLKAVRKWKRMPDRQPSADSVCALIESMEGD
jgi:MerR family transcriptional regulator, Zn(II)-responsive regulator of zntA